MEEDIFDGLGSLRLMYSGKEVDGEIINYVEEKDPVLKDLIFTLDGKKYKIVLEEIQ